MNKKLTPIAMGLCISIFGAQALAETNSANTGSENTKMTTATSQSQALAAAPSPNVQSPGPSSLPASGPLYLPVDLDVPGQSFVSSGPYIGIPLEFSGSNLIVNSPNVNEDIALLKIRKNIAQRLSDLLRPQDTSGSHVLLSGLVESQGIYRAAGGGEHNTSDIDLTTVNFDAYILGPSSWTSGLIEFSYDNNIGTETGSFSSNDRMFNSRVYVNKAFVVLGNFQQSPFYSSFGQMYVPFGVYSTTMVSSPLTKILGRTQARALVVGYQQQSTNSLNVSGYVFRGPSHVGDKHRVNNGGLNIDYRFQMNSVNADMGVGMIANLADSQGMQFTGNNNNNPPLFGGFGGPTETFTNSSGVVEQINTGNEELEHRVPAINLHALLGIGDNTQLIGEFVGATTSFSPEDMTYDGDGAKPYAWSIEVVRNLPRFKKPTSLSIGYQRSQEALAIGLPKIRYSAVINTSYWKSTLQSLEFRHDINYGDDATSSGSGVTGPSGGGHSVNMVTFQFDYYF